MAFLTIRVPESLKRKMRRIRGVNWSDFLRAAIEAKVSEELRSLRLKDVGMIRRAIKIQDNAAARLRPIPGWSSTEVIRYWREHRYSSLTHR